MPGNWCFVARLEAPVEQEVFLLPAGLAQFDYICSISLVPALNVSSQTARGVADEFGKPSAAVTGEERQKFVSCRGDESARKMAGWRKPGAAQAQK